MRREAGTASPAWSPREREVLDLIARGHTNGEIAEALGISFATAKWHVSELISKLGVESREQVASYWRRERSIGSRFRHLAQGIAGFAAIKLAAGGALAATAAVGGGALWVQLSGGQTGRAPIAVVATVTPVPAPPPGRLRFASAVQGADGCIPSEERGRPLCDYRRYPEIVKLDKGNCDFSGVVFPPVGPTTQMNYIDLHGCNLSGAVLRGMAANEADFSGANLTGADLTGASLFRSDFRWANLTNAKADPGVFQEVNFEGANLTGANFANAIVTPANWRNTTCPDGSNSDANGGTCVGTPGLENPPTTYDTHVQPAGICPSDGRMQPPGFLCAPSLIPILQGKDLGGCNYTAADLSGLTLQNADFRGCTLAGANLAGTKLERASFAGANVANASFAGALLRGADFGGAAAQDADFNGAHLGGVRFVDANLLRATVNGALLDAFFSNTICPDGSNSDFDDTDARTCFNNLIP